MIDLTNFKRFRDTNYYISQDGGVWCFKPATKWSPERFTERKPTMYTGGYYKLNILGKSISVHKMVATAFFGERPEGLQINHKNGVKTDNRPDNLEYVTRSYNMAHATHVLKTVSVRETKLTESIVRSIRRSKLSNRVLGIKYGVSKYTIKDIRRKKTWKWVK